MNIEKIKDKAATTKDEVQDALREHARLAREQYEDLTERHGDPVERVENAVREPLEETREQVVALSKQVNQQTEDIATDLARRTDRVTRIVNTEAQRLGEELDERTREIRFIVRDRFGFEPRARTNSEPEADKPPTPPAKETTDASVPDEEEAAGEGSSGNTSS